MYNINKGKTWWVLLQTSFPPVPSGKGRRGGNSHLPMVAMSSPTESQWDVMQSKLTVGLIQLNVAPPGFVIYLSLPR